MDAYAIGFGWGFLAGVMAIVLLNLIVWFAWWIFVCRRFDD